MISACLFFSTRVLRNINLNRYNKMSDKNQEVTQRTRFITRSGRCYLQIFYYRIPGISLAFQRCNADTLKNFCGIRMLVTLKVETHICTKRWRLHQNFTSYLQLMMFLRKNRRLHRNFIGYVLRYVTSFEAFLRYLYASAKISRNASKILRSCFIWTAHKALFVRENHRDTNYNFPWLLKMATSSKNYQTPLSFPPHLSCITRQVEILINNIKRVLPTGISFSWIIRDDLTKYS